MASCCWMHGKVEKGVGIRLVPVSPFVAHCTRSDLNWVRNNVELCPCGVKLGALSPVCPWCFTPNNSYSTSRAHSTAEYFWAPLGAWWRLFMPGDIFSCVPALSQHPVEPEPPHKNSQRDFIVFSLINLCRKPKAIPVPGSSSLAGNPNFTERSNMTVVMKTRQKQKTVNIFIATGAITIHRVYSELSAMPVLIWDPVKTKLQVKFLAWPLHQILVSFSVTAWHWLHYEIH